MRKSDSYVTYTKAMASGFEFLPIREIYNRTHLTMSAIVYIAKSGKAQWTIDPVSHKTLYRLDQYPVQDRTGKIIFNNADLESIGVLRADRAVILNGRRTCQRKAVIAGIRNAIATRNLSQEDLENYKTILERMA